MAEDLEPTVLEYARLHCLTIDYLAINPLDKFEGGAEDVALLDDSHLQQLTDLPYPEKERIGATKNALSLLSTVFKQPERMTDMEIYCSPNLRRTRDLKVELPMLHTDHEIDMINFSQRLMPDFTNLHLLPERTNENLDDCLAWSLDDLGLPSKLNDRIVSERPSFPRASLLYLQELLGCNRPQNGPEEWEQDLKPRKKVNCKPHINAFC